METETLCVEKSLYDIDEFNDLWGPGDSFTPVSLTCFEFLIMFVRDLDGDRIARLHVTANPDLTL